MMVMKRVRKLTLVVMELFILIFLNVQANDLAPTSFYPSLPPIPLPYSFKVDHLGPMDRCLTRAIKDCECRKYKWPHRGISISRFWWMLCSWHIL